MTGEKQELEPGYSCKDCNTVSSYEEVDNICPNCGSDRIELIKECELCNEEVLSDDMYVALRVGVEHGREDVEGVTHYHAGCFMDIVNINNRSVSRTAIMKGEIDRTKDENGELKLELGRQVTGDPIEQSRLREHRD